MELFGILGAVQSIQTHCSTIHAKKFRIITDSHVALRELNRTFTHNSTATNILFLVRDLAHEGITIRMVWTPAHMSGADGNRTAHSAARECLLNPPTVLDTTSAHSDTEQI